MQTNFREILLYLRKNYKPIAQISDELGICYTTLKRACRTEGKTFHYDNGKKIIDLYKRVQDERKIM